MTKSNDAPEWIHDKDQRMREGGWLQTWWWKEGNGYYYYHLVTETKWDDAPPEIQKFWLEDRDFAVDKLRNSPPNYWTKETPSESS